MHRTASQLADGNQSPGRAPDRLSRSRGQHARSAWRRQSRSVGQRQNRVRSIGACRLCRAETHLAPARVLEGHRLGRDRQSRRTSDSAWFEIGLLKRSDWKAKWIGAALRGGPRSTFPCPYLRKAFKLPARSQIGAAVCDGAGPVRMFDQRAARRRRCVRPRLDGLRQARAVQGLRCDEPAASAAKTRSARCSAMAGLSGIVGWHAPQQYVDRPRLLAQLEVTLADGRSSASSPIAPGNSSSARCSKAIC